MRERLDLRAPEALQKRLGLIAAMSFVENLLGRHARAHARLERALEELPDHNSAEAVALMTELGVEAFFAKDYASMCAYTQRALEAARPLRDPVVAANPAGVRAFAWVLAGRFDEAGAVIDEAATLLDGMSDEELARPESRRSLSQLACAELYFERYADAHRHSERALSVALATGQGQVVPILFWASMIRTACGRLEEAAQVQDVAIDVARLSGYAQGLAWTLASRVLTATAAGDVESALAAAEESVETAGIGTDDATFPAMWAQLVLAQALAEAGDGMRATEVAYEGAGGEELPVLPPGWRPQIFEVLTRAALLRGSRDDAVRAAERAAACAEEQKMLRLPRAWSQRAAAAIALEDGDAGDAASRALDAAAAAAEVDAPIEEGIGRLLAGRALAAAGERDRAATELESAAAIFESCGALPRRDACDRELGKLGKRVHRRTKRGKLDGTGIE